MRLAAGHEAPPYEVKFIRSKAGVPVRWSRDEMI